MKAIRAPAAAKPMIRVNGAMVTKRTGSCRGLYLARLASTCWTLSRGPPFNHAVAVTVMISTTNAMKSSRIIAASLSSVPV